MQAKNTSRFFRFFLAKLYELFRVLSGARKHPFLSINTRAYQRWIAKHEPGKKERKELKKKSQELTYKPAISIVVPVYNTEPQWLDRALESVLNQVYENWELCLVNDGSPETHVRETLEKWQTNNNHQIKVKHLEHNRGIAAASNEALAMAKGEYIAFMDSDDELHPLALFEVVKLLNHHPDADVIYTDEDKITLDGQRKKPVFKSNWSADLFLTYNYINHLTVCRKTLIDQVGGFRPEFNWSQDYDLYLRITENTGNIFHIPQVLYHWRTIPGSSASKVDTRTEALEKSKQLLTETLHRRGIKWMVTQGLRPGTFRVKKIGRLEVKKVKHFVKKKLFGIADFRMEDFKYQKELKRNALTRDRLEAVGKEMQTFTFKPRISVVMPVYNIEKEILKQAVDSVLNQIYGIWELCIADDASPMPHIRVTLEQYQGIDARIKVKFLEKNQGMSGASNEALSLATGQYVAFLDHDDELSRDSLWEVVKLLNQHPEAGIIYTDEDKLTMTGNRLRPVYKPDWDPELFLTYNYLCHLVVCRRELVFKAGGFRKGFEGSQDYDLLLRVTELTDKIFHIPKVLYHWRMVPGSAALVVDAKKEAFEKSKQALRDAMERRGITAQITNGDTIGTFKVRKI